MPQIARHGGADSPGIRPAQIFSNLDDREAAQLLPNGAFSLINILGRDRLLGTKRADTLGQILSLELAVDDPARRAILLGGIPEFKVEELERRVGMSIDELRQNGELEQPTRRALLGFLGLATVAQRVSVRANDVESVTPSRGLFPHQKRAAIAVERYLYYENGRVMLHLPTGVGKTRTAMSIVATHLRTYRSGLIVWLVSCHASNVG